MYVDLNIGKPTLTYFARAKDLTQRVASGLLYFNQPN